MKGLNAEQLAALDDEAGDVLLVACPGSGKTQTLIHKVALELSKLTSHREFVVALTYTHVAADEIRDRIEELGVDTSQLWVGTIHSFCLTWILKPYSLYHDALKEGFGVVDTYESEELLDELAREHPPLQSHYDCNYYATSKGYDLGRADDPMRTEALRLTIEEYHSALLDRRLIDFEMMLKFSHDLLQQHASIAPRLGQMLRFIAIDEYQDTRDIQYSIVGRIVSESQNNTGLFLVGDPNQAIFGSLGGVAKSKDEIAAITQRDIRELALRRNYRSSQIIVDYFSHFAVEPVHIEAVGSCKDWKSSVVHDVSVEKSDLVTSIAGVIEHNIEELGVDPSSICIVAPWWMHLAAITRSLVQALPQYEFNGPGLSPFGQNLDNFWYKVARIALTTAAPDMFRKRLRWAQEVVDELVSGGHVSELLSARQLLKMTNGIDVHHDSGSEYLRLFFGALCEQLGFTLSPGTELHEQRRSFFERMENRLERIRSTEGVDVDDLATCRKVFRPRTGIVVSTIHGVKGAEFDSVIAFGLLEGIVPHFTEVPEFRESIAKRLLFVIGSRARKELYLVSEAGRGTTWRPKEQSNVLRALESYSYTARSLLDLPT